MQRDWQTRSELALAQGSTGTNSKRANHFINGVYPTHLVYGDGCYVYDPEGNRYLDFIAGLGTAILGYNHPKVNEYVTQSLSGSLSLPSTLEVELAETIQDLIPTCEKVRFLKTGSEATNAAIRIARAYNDHEEVYSQGYHGHSDLFTFLTEPAIGVEDLFYISNMKILEPVTYQGTTILEPVMLDYSEKRHAEIREFQAVYNKQVIIFDEIITGFRMPKITVANEWDCKPDMICLGKAMANGFPLAVVGGTKDIMDATEYFVSSTYSGETASLAAATATIKEITQKQNLVDLMYYGERMREKLNALHPQIKFEGYGTRAQLNTDCMITQLFMQEMCKAGILLGRAWFYTFAHMEADIEDYLLNVAHDIIARINRHEVKLEGDPPVTGGAIWTSRNA